MIGSLINNVGFGGLKLWLPLQVSDTSIPILRKKHIFKLHRKFETRVPNCHKIRPFDGWEYFDWQF